MSELNKYIPVAERSTHKEFDPEFAEAQTIVAYEKIQAVINDSTLTEEAKTIEINHFAQQLGVQLLTTLANSHSS